MKGQASVEFIIVLALALLFIVAVIQPNALAAQNSVEDTANLAKLNISAEKLANTIQYISLSGEGSKQTIEIIVPTGATLECNQPNNNNIRYAYTMKTGPGTAACNLDADTDPSKCAKVIDAKTAFSCTGITNPIQPGIYSGVIQKNTGNTITATFTLVAQP